MIVSQCYSFMWLWRCLFEIGGLGDVSFIGIILGVMYGNVEFGLEPSLAVSVKMNILLSSPALLMCLLLQFKIVGTIPKLAICGILQLILGAPFLTTNFWSYINGAFDLRRQFFYKWSVNWKFIGEHIFLSKQWAFLTLLATALVILLFIVKWIK